MGSAEGGIGYGKAVLPQGLDLGDHVTVTRFLFGQTGQRSLRDFLF